MSNFAHPLYSKKRVNWAGDILLAGSDASLADHIQALEIINNWRASHSQPLLSTRMSLSGRARRVDPGALIAQRLKRLPSIELKLRRNPHMRLSQMQDTGGCRAVVKDMPALRDLYGMYAKSIESTDRSRPQCCEVYDYIAEPKGDGYRGLHLVYKYGTRTEALNTLYGGMRVEIQLRSHLQHVWATAVEIVGAFTHQALKSGLGSDQWRRFFVLMANAIAFRESAPRVPNAHLQREPLVAELKKLARELGVVRALQSMKAVVQHISTEVQSEKLFLLELDTQTGVVKVWGFGVGQDAIANEQYLRVEKDIADDPSKQAVLVTVDSLAALPNAFPNYYADTGAFLGEVQRLLTS
ncbi:MAG: RelA/SpoT domain-containing protein [Gemmatimonadales bacterium]|nr:RelA/SpoT domain-containing protein [Gemmatimonadales bacterium]